MNNIIGLFVILIVSLHCFSQNNMVRIDGQFLNYDGTSKAWYSLSPTQGAILDKEIQPDSLGRITIIESINETQYFYINYRSEGINHDCCLILQPGNDYTFISEGYNEDEWDTKYSPYIYSRKRLSNEVFSISKLDQGQIFYNEIADKTSGALYHDDWDLMHPEGLLDTLQFRIESELEDLNKLYEVNNVDEEQYEIIKLNIEYVNAYRLAQTINDSWQLENKFGIEDSSINNELYKIYSELFDLYPVEGVRIEDFFGFGKYVDLYLLYKEDSQNGEFIPVERKGPSAIGVFLENAKEILSPKAYQAYRFNNTLNFTANLGINASLMASTYLEENPEVRKEYAGKLLEEQLLPRAVEFENLKYQSLSDQMIILDERNPINSFEQLVDSLHGRPFLIDLWATWCMPCRSQFQFNGKLKPFLKRQGIEMVYIAKEYDLSKEQLEYWKNYIKGYNLDGYHLIMNDKLEASLEGLVGEIYGIPRYILVNEDGVVVEPDAYKPSDTDLLKEQIRNSL